MDVSVRVESDMRSWGPVEWMNAWKESKDAWQVPQAENYAISTCTIGAKLEPSISFPRMAEWLLARKTWERVRDNSNILVKWETSDRTDAHIEGFLFWNPKKLTRGAKQEQDTDSDEWQRSPGGQDAHQSLPNYFYNSVTIYVNLGEGRKKINLKYFLNGSMTLTGCSGMQDAKDAVFIWQNMLQSRPEWWEVPESNFRISQDFKFNMMNAYFALGFSVDCLKVYEFCRDHLGLFVDYDPKQYQGVIIYYMWNRNQEDHNGICDCSGEFSCPFSAKRRRGEGDGDCIKLTFIVFSTGKVLITGGISMEQVQDCYNFFTSQFRQHAKKLVQFSLKDFMDKNLATLQPVKEKRRGKRRTNVKAADPVISQEIRLTQFWPQSTD